MPGHQKCSHNKDKVWSCPWWSTSQWHPFKVVTQWALGTTKIRRSLVSPLGVEHRYKTPWWTIEFCPFYKMSLPSLLEVCAFKSVFFCAFTQSNTVLNIGSSFWASAQSVTCICTSVWPARYLLLRAVVTLNYGGVLNFSPVHWSQCDSVEDWSHCVWVQSSSNLAQCICHCVITSFLVFQFKLELHKGTDSSVTHSI